MHRPIFGHSFAVLVAPILLSALAFNFLYKKKTSAHRNAEDADIGTSSSTTASTRNYYEVFLSFRGLDTRKGFTDHLYNELIKAGIHTFRDDDKLRQGENIRSELLAAITDSQILIPVLSKNYGASRWCLDELVQIMKCKNNNGHIVLPIFYKVKPAEVRYQIGSFKNTFPKHGRRFNKTILEKWKKALREVSELKGHEANEYEAKLVKRVVREVLSELKKKFGLFISENLVGIDNHVNKVMDFMDNKYDATLFVGIHGMGGVGKTTLAKTIYNKLSNQFEHRSFIADIRESCKRNGVHYLQNQFIYHILKQENEVCNEDEGIEFISSKFKGIKVLVLLDDVDDIVQLKRLAGHHDWFSLGSRIIITTRNKRVLKEAKVDYSYKHETMDANQSLILFSKHAFRRDSPPTEFDDLTNEVVSITGGLPLSLEVFGSSFCGIESTQWRDKIDKLKKVPPLRVQERLKISYEELDYRQKQIFLDIACFFIGTDKMMASYMWKACDFFPGEGIEELIFRSLIKVGDDHKFIMHDQLRDLGREIVCEENHQEPWYRSRLWDHKEVQKVLKGNKGTNKIQAIIVSEDYSDGKDGNIYTEKQFKNLKGLRFLDMNGANLRGNFRNSIGGLKWLQWQYCPMNFEAKNFPVRELAVLDLSHGNISKKWEGWSTFMLAKNLKFLDLASCPFLENTDFLSAFKNLEILILNDCKKLQQIDSSIEDMKALIRLELCSCTRLTEISVKIGKLQKLQQLLLQGTQALYALPYSIQFLQNLEILNISDSGIKELPEGIGKLRKLRHLDASKCKKLGGEMPESIGSLENLEILDISATNIKELPNSIERLRKLRNLNFSGCQNMEGEMLKSMCNLSSLQCLNFLGCEELQSLPDLPSSLTFLGITCQSRKLPSLSHLTHLKELKVHKCKFLECIQELPSGQLKNSECSQPPDVEESKLPQSLSTPFKLEILEVKNCESIKILDISQFIHLRIFSIHHCKTILEVQVLDNLKYLESLIIGYCDSIKQLDLSKFKGLKRLDVYSCYKLVRIQGLDRLKLLERLHIFHCTSIKRLFLPECGSLKKLGVSCEKLLEIQGLDKLECLEELDISWCSLIKKLHLPNFGSMKILRIQQCDILVEIQGLNTQKFLRQLDVHNTSIEMLDLPKPGSLKNLFVKVKNLVEIRGLNGLEFLKTLGIIGCTSIEKLDLPKSRDFEILTIKNCENLVEIQGVDRLELLEISKCASIERLDFPKSDIDTLKVVNCSNLVEIQSLNKLEFLKISECPSIERLNIPKSNIRKLDVAKCNNLVEIQGLDQLDFFEDLIISSCASIEMLDLPKSVGMKTLCVNNCTNLVKIHGLDKLESLEILDISSYASIERLDLSKSMGIWKLIAENCASLVEIHGLDRLEFLKYLDISQCALIERLDLSKSVGMEFLYVENCASLVEIHGLNKLEFLKELDISRCALIERLDLSKSTGMELLHAEKCANLIEIDGLDRMEFLKWLNISGCTSFERLPNLCCPDTLETLNINCCDKLQDIQSLERFSSRVSLWIEDCKSLTKLPNLSSFHNLRKLFLSNCHELREIPGLEEAISLQCIAILGGSSIEILPDLSSCTRLLELVVQDCEKLTELRGLEKLEQLKVLDISGCKLLKTIPDLPGTRLYQNHEKNVYNMVWMDFESNDRSHWMRLSAGPPNTQKSRQRQLIQQWELHELTSNFWW